jgi:hypothetical protein
MQNNIPYPKISPSNASRGIVKNSLDILSNNPDITKMRLRG